MKFAVFGAAALAAAALVGPSKAQQVIEDPGYCAQYYPNANCQNLGPGNPYTGGYQRQIYQNQVYRDQAYRQNGHWRNSHNRWDGRDSFSPGDVAAGVVGGAVGTAAAVATAPIGGEAYARR